MSERLDLDALDVPGVQATRTGIIVDPGCSFEAWERAGFELGVWRTWTAFALGDWYLSGEELFGQRAAQAVDATSGPPERLTELVRVATKVDPARRRMGLS